MVSEIIRWQTPLAYMRRVTKKDVTLNGQIIKEGDKVVMWYASGNRDERAFEQDPDQFIIDRKNVRKHLSFGFGRARVRSVQFCTRLQCDDGNTLRQALTRRLTPDGHHLLNCFRSRPAGRAVRNQV
ncbi:cytochrome P450 [Marinobacter shengliensis]|uniref:cytochrome P450 n=1 Tax=Marinobacter shengliensis TaxID=1389223 RepID=UPI0035B9C655